MSKSSSTVLAVLALTLFVGQIVCATPGHGAPRKLMQGAGVGAGCESILKNADDGTGYSVEDTENTVASDVSSMKLGRKLRQGAGVGAGCNSVLTQGDNGVGYSVEDTENTVAGDLGGRPAPGTGTGKKLLAAAEFKGARGLLQTDKIANGANAVASSLGASQQGAAVGQFGDDIDSELTGDTAADGASAGALEATLPEATKAIPGRRLQSMGGTRGILQTDKIANGANAVMSSLGANQQGAAVGQFGDDIDGELTGDSAQVGQQAGTIEATLPEATKAIPGRRM